MSSEREAVERLTKFSGDWPAWIYTDQINADLRLILTDYARLQSESAKDGEAFEHIERGWAPRGIARSRLSARKATPPAGSTQIGEG